MNVLKQNTCIVFLFTLLVAVAAIPFFLISHNNNRLIDSITICNLPLQPSTNQQHAQSYNVWERMKTMKESDVVVEQPSYSLLYDITGNVIGTMEDQLRELQNLKALPPFTFASDYQASISKKTYIRPQNPKDALNVWIIHAEYPDFDVNAYMDIETFILYSITIQYKSDTFPYETDSVSKDGFLAYLQLNSKGRKEQEERFDVAGYYSDKSLRLFVISHNDNTQKTTSYTFDDDKSYMLIDEADVYELVHKR